MAPAWACTTNGALSTITWNVALKFALVAKLPSCQVRLVSWGAPVWAAITLESSVEVGGVMESLMTVTLLGSKLVMSRFVAMPPLLLSVKK